MILDFPITVERIERDEEQKRGVKVRRSKALGQKTSLTRDGPNKQCIGPVAWLFHQSLGFTLNQEDYPTAQ